MIRYLKYRWTQIKHFANQWRIVVSALLFTCEVLVIVPCILFMIAGIGVCFRDGIVTFHTFIPALTCFGVVILLDVLRFLVEDEDDHIPFSP